MKSRFIQAVLLTLAMVSVSGCHWFVPGSIKRQTNLVNLDVKTALKEIQKIEKDESKTEQQRLTEIKEKSLIVLKRLKPQVQNIDDYTHGRPASPIEE
jgi:hypothetical protein